MPTWTSRRAAGCFLAVLVSFTRTLPAQEEGALRIGALAVRGVDACRAQWQPTAEYLSQTVPGHRFEIVPLTFDEIDRAVRYAQVDFVVANPAVYVSLNSHYGVSRLATLNSLTASGLASTVYGGVVFCRRDRQDIQRAGDLKGKTFLAVDETSLGGWLMVLRELKEHGIEPRRDFKSLRFAGTHDAVVQAVLNGQADAGTVRTDTLQRMAREDGIDLAQLKVIPVYEGPLPATPFMTSTRLYPQWPFSRVLHVSEDLATAVTIALLQMPREAPAAVAAECAGWTVAHNYETVHDCLREMRVGPYVDYGRITVRGALRQYWFPLSILLVLLAALAAAVLAQWRANRRLRDLHALQRQLLDTAATAVFTVDTEKRITGVNEAFLNLTGFTEAEVIGKSCRVLEGSPCRDRCGLFDPSRTGKISRRQCTLRARDGRQLTVLKNATLTRDARGRITGGVESFVDVTPLIQARLEAEAANQAKGDFLANMSHEIRTPMNAIIGMTDLALDTDLSTEQRDYLVTVKQSADSLLTLVNDILDFSKIEAGKMEIEEFSFNVRDVVEDTVRTLAVRAHEKRLELLCRVGAGVPETARGDAGRLRQILMNLVGNAIKFTQEGEVVVTVEAEAVSEEGVRLHGRVRDTGIGIPIAQQEHIFDLFAQADSSVTRTHGGTGLGLSICRQLTALMRGRVWVESPVPVESGATRVGGPGSVFHFTVSLRPGDVPPVRARVTPEALNRLPVLVVDDNATNRRLLQEWLLNWSLCPTLTASGPEAVKLAGQACDAGQPYRLMLIDANMPDMDGFTTAGQVRAISPETITMMLTSGGRRGDAARCREAGIVAYLMKPIKQSDLFDALVTAVAASGPVAEQELITRHSLRERGRSLKILLVEDNPVNQKLAMALLDKRGHRVLLAADGQEAMVHLAQERFDLVLMDVQMPRMDGLEATRHIRDPNSAVLDHAVPVVAMTAHAMQGDREACLEAGMNEYLSKPIRPDDLFRVLRRFAAGSEPEGPEAGAGEAATTSLRAELLRRVEGDEALLRELVSLFLDGYPGLLKSIRTALDNGDTAGLARQAHALKGMVGNFEKGMAYELALQVERAARAGEPDRAREPCLALDEAVEALREQLVSVTA